MNKKLLSTLIIAAAIGTHANAQQKVYLNKGNENVATIELAANDYIAFGRPKGVAEKPSVMVASTETGKTYVSYTVETRKPTQLYQHALLKASFLELFMIQYQGVSLSAATPAQLQTAFKTLLTAGYGYSSTGTKSFTFTNGEKDAAGETSFIPGGQEFYLVTCDVKQDGENYSLGNDLLYKVISTKPHGTSTEKLNVKFNGYTDNGAAKFDIQPTEGIKTLHAVLGTKKSIDEFVNIYSYDYMMFTQSNELTRDEWMAMDEDSRAWNISKEDDYSFCVLGIDNNGDWVKEQIDMRIKPTSADDCADIDLSNYASDTNGNVTATMTVKSKASTIKKATVRLMTETAWDNALNTYAYETPQEAWPEEAVKGNAIDITNEVNANGKYTFNQTISESDRDWYVLVFAVTDDNGTTVTRAAFHSHKITDEWELISHTYPKTATGAASNKKMFKVLE